MAGIIGKKIGMTSVYTEEGYNIACTLIEAGDNVITQIRTTENDGYSAVQVGFDNKKEKRTSQPLKGHFEKSGATPKKKLVEFRDPKDDFSPGQILKIEEVFKVGDVVDITGTSKGKGFQGVVKRHGFGGVGQATHGQHNRLRAPGSVGACSYPARVFKGLRMAGRTGGQKVKVENLRIMRIFPEKNILVVSGAIPGAKNSYVIISK